MTLRRRPYKVKILYKSGNSITFRCKEFNIKWSPHREVSWDGAKPAPMYVGVEEIEAAWIL